MSEYVPTTDADVRLVWGLWFGPGDYARFDAWLAEHDRQVAERVLAPLAAATQALLDVMTEIDGRRLIPACNAFTDDDGYCRVCTAMQNADQAIEEAANHV